MDVEERKGSLLRRLHRFQSQFQIINRWIMVSTDISTRIPSHSLGLSFYHLSFVYQFVINLMPFRLEIVWEIITWFLNDWMASFITMPTTISFSWLNSWSLFSFGTNRTPLISKDKDNFLIIKLIMVFIDISIRIHCHSLGLALLLAILLRFVY